MKTTLIKFLALFSASITLEAQNIAVNTTGASATATNMFEVTQISTTLNSVGLYTLHSGAVVGTGYGFQSLKTGAGTTNIAGYFSATGGTNNYAIIVPTASGSVGIGTSLPTSLLDVRGGLAAGYMANFLNTNATGTGLVARGNNQAASTGANGNGVSAIGNDIGLFGFSTNVGSSQGVVGLSDNGLTYYTTGVGSGGAFTGLNVGLTCTRDDVADINNEGGAWISGKNDATRDVFVAWRTGGTWYKITGPGTAGTFIKDNLGRDRVMACPEAPEILFQDFGPGQLQNGKAHIVLDSLLAAHIKVNDLHPLRVFVQLEDNCKGVYVANKTGEGFDVLELDNGASNARFTWFITANRADDIDPKTGEVESKNADWRFPVFEHPRKIANQVKRFDVMDLILGK